MRWHRAIRTVYGAPLCLQGRRTSPHNGVWSGVDGDFIPDGNAEFTTAMGMLIDKRGNGFGERSRRYAMLVRDGVIEKLYVEELRPDGTETYGVSDADTILTHLAG